MSYCSCLIWLKQWVLRNCSSDEIRVYKESNRPICTTTLHICFNVRKYETESKFKLLIFFDENQEVAIIVNKRSKSTEYVEREMRSNF